MTAEEESALVREIEGHLLLTAAREEGRTAAVRVASRLGWLTDDQHECLERQLEIEYLSLARTSWRRTADRAAELQRTYEERYRALRRRLVAWCVLSCALPAATVLLVLAAA
ncbi:hypothetical protein AB0C13_34150 [Streptomyces sp. NPDC049099]|uniref:hypothetical protein n=1 Tax=Streptomyces sp. NPDC049099 TaxID=3155768 RepID=UPI0034426E5F